MYLTETNQIGQEGKSAINELANIFESHINGPSSVGFHLEQYENSDSPIP